jgi:hypothetical protein
MDWGLARDYAARDLEPEETHVTEAEWLACTDPIRMLDHLGAHCSRRNLQPFGAAGVRSLASVLGNDQELLADLQEQVADGLATRDDLEWFLIGGMRELWVPFAGNW